MVKTQVLRGAVVYCAPLLGAPATRARAI